MLVSLMGSTRLRPTEKSLLFHTNMLLHTWLLSIRKNVAYYSLWWSLFLLYFSLSETVKMSLSLLGGSWLPLEFGLLGCLMMSARSLWWAQEKLGFWRLSGSFRLLGSSKIHCSCLHPKWKWKSYLPMYTLSIWILLFKGSY